MGEAGEEETSSFCVCDLVSPQFALGPTMLAVFARAIPKVVMGEMPF